MLLKRELKKNLKLHSLTPEGSLRRYFRIQTDKGSYILSHSPGDQKKKFLSRQKLFSKIGLNVPKLYPLDLLPIELLKSTDLLNSISLKKTVKDRSFSSSHKAFILMEDLGDQSLEKKVFKRKNFPVSYYKKALDQIIALQWQKEQCLQKDFFRFKGFFKEMLWTEKYLIKKLLNFRPDKVFRENYLKEWKSICKELVSFPLKPAHRDYHSRNLFIKSGELYWIDFQDADLFPRFYDVVSLLYDVYVQKKMNPKTRKNLLKYFKGAEYFKSMKYFKRAEYFKSVEYFKGMKYFKSMEHLERTHCKNNFKSVEHLERTHCKNNFKSMEHLERTNYENNFKSVEHLENTNYKKTVEDELLITALQRLFKASGSFASFYVLKNQKTHLKYIKPALKQVKTLLKQQKNRYPCFLKLVQNILKACTF